MVESHSTKATAVSESNNVGAWGWIPRAPDANRGDAAAILQLFSKIRIFRHILIQISA